VALLARGKQLGKKSMRWLGTGQGGTWGGRKDDANAYAQKGGAEKGTRQRRDRSLGADTYIEVVVVNTSQEVRGAL